MGRGRRVCWLLAAACIALVIAGGVAFVLTGQSESDGEQADELSQLGLPVSQTTQPAPAVVPPTTVPTVATSTAAPVTAPPTSDVVPVTSPPLTVPNTIGPTDVAPGTYSIAETHANTVTAQRFRMTIGAAGSKTVAEGAIDEHNRMDMTMTVGRDQSVRMIMDIDNGLVYYSGGPFEDVLTDGAEWVQFPLASMVRRSGQSLDGFLETVTGRNPATGMLDDDLVQLGLTDIDGQSVMLYWVALDQNQFSELVEGNPQFADGGTLQQTMFDADSVTYKFYVTEDNTLRRMEAVTDIYGQVITSTYDYFPLEPGYAVQLPDPATVRTLEDSGA